MFIGSDGVRPAWRAAGYVSLVFLLLFIVQTSVFHFYGAISMVTPGGIAFSELISVACALAPAAVMGRLEDRGFADYGLPWRGAFGGLFWQGALWGAAQLSVQMLLISAFGGYSFGELALHGAALLRYALEWGGAFLLVGLNEEFFFRGYAQFTLASGARFWPAAAVTSFAFAAVHLGNPGEGYAGAASIFVLGFFLCLTLRRTGSLWFAIGWHAAWDFGETYLYSVPNSGIVLAPHVSFASLHGPGWITGGSIGPEGSVFDFLLLGVSFVVFDRLYRPRPEAGL